ncbi:BMP family lipoprotein [Sutcliffiella halmapala]|uniref:BMP family lipoprotein n=1 Tax=Sutcliffiella halmapala TaxID=79882 RepID=UPI000995AEA5|nr:BMP family ABC transporter substrate-binding protein [Sutcliffiella halmapala]
MKFYRVFIIFVSILFLLGGCSNKTVNVNMKATKSVGIMLSDVGLGDQSFSDAAFAGLVRARDELGIVFSYKELSQTESYEKGLMELVEEKHDLIVGLGFMVQEDLEKVAAAYPDQQFLLVDSISDLSNIASITFKENEGSFLAGALAAQASTTNKLGFVGGADVPLIQKFLVGFEHGAKSMNPSIEVIPYFANDFGNSELGTQLAKKLIENDVDVLYAAAGLTGIGVLHEAQNQGKLAIGVDSDQFFYAEKAVITSMMKHVDVALFNVMDEFVASGDFPTGTIELGLAEGGVGLSPIRIMNHSTEQQEQLEEWKEKIIDGTITVK